MRAGSLSHKDVIAKLKKRYVCAWDNTEGECNAGGSFAHPPTDPAPRCIRGNGEHNVQMLFLTPDRKLLHTAAGFVSGDDLVKEIQFVDILWEMVRRAKTDSAKKHLIQKAHEQALRDAKKRLFSGPLAKWAKRRVLADHGFARRNPLLPASSYRSEDHVGKSQSWFGSTSGGPPSGTIGKGRINEKLDKMLRLGTVDTDGGKLKDLPDDVKKQIRDNVVSRTDIPDAFKEKLEKLLGE